MKIIVYTISDCQFSKQEKEYLQAKGLSFEEKNLETNREFLTEMLALSNNFAGTPVTKIEKDDGQIVVLKGFTTEEFDKALGFQTVAPAIVEPALQVQAPVVQPTVVAPVIPVPQLEQSAVQAPVVMPAPVAPIVDVQPVQAQPIAEQLSQAPVIPPMQSVPPMNAAPTIPAIPSMDAVMQPPVMPIAEQQPVIPAPVMPVQPAPVAQDMNWNQSPTMPVDVQTVQPQQVTQVPDQALNDILSSLQTKVEDTTAPQAPTAFPTQGVN